MPSQISSARDLGSGRRRAGQRASLSADCDRCCGLCCVATAFSTSPEFAFDKPAETACPNLLKSFRCGVHDRLREKGFGGCVAFDCYGAGQKVTQITFGGTDWQGEPQIAQQMFRVFRTMRQLQTLLMYLDLALDLALDLTVGSAPNQGPTQTMHGELEVAYERIESLTQKSAVELEGLDASEVKSDVHLLLLRVSELVRSQA